MVPNVESNFFLLVHSYILQWELLLSTMGIQLNWAIYFFHVYSSYFLPVTKCYKNSISYFKYIIQKLIFVKHVTNTKIHMVGFSKNLQIIVLKRYFWVFSSIDRILIYY